MRWLRIIRPQTLFASFCPVAVALLTQSEPVSWPVAIVTIICALALQILSNLINDYYDYRRGTDKKGRVGFRRALAEGEVTERQMLIACLITLGVCLLTGFYLVWIGGWVILLIGLTALLFAWLYTATSKSLSYLGIADIFVFLYYGVIAACGTYYLQISALHQSSIAQSDQSSILPVFCAGAVCGLISMCVLLINNLRDIEDDRAVGKRTLPVRFGRKAGLGLMLVVVLLMPIFAYMAYGWSLPMLVIVPALVLCETVRKAEGKKYNLCLLAAGLINALYTILVAVNCAILIK